jgi:uncharacterized protein
VQPTEDGQVEHRPVTDPWRDPRLERLAACVRGYESVVVAYSGGIDSTLVAYVAARTLGDRALAVTGISASLAGGERVEAEALARQLGVAHRVVDTHELERDAYRANTGDRCYHCKSELFDVLAQFAAREGFATVASGDNLDDLAPGEYRPGLRAAEERAVRRPLVEAELGKRDIRELARALGIPNHGKPATPCLASRVPHGTPVDVETLRRIEAAEAGVRALGIAHFRVRHHGEVARLEVPSADFERVLEQRAAIVAAVKAAGYTFVALDLAGFRSGSLNVLLHARREGG